MTCTGGFFRTDEKVTDVTIEAIKIPDIGGADSVEVIEVCVAVGDTVAAEDSLIVLESDKASMEVPAPKAGKVVSVSIAEGDTASEGDVILELDVAGADDNDTEAASEQAAEDTAEEPSQQAAAAPEPAATDETTETTVETIKVPDIGGADSVDVIEVSVASGDEVEEGDSLIVLESDKASMEVPSPKSGRIVSVAIKEGDKVVQGDAILELEIRQAATASAAPEAAAKPAAAEKAAPAAEPPAKAAPASPAVEPATIGDAVYAGPAVRRMARELGVSLNAVKGSGPRGRIQKEDLQQYVKNALSSGSASAGAGLPAMPDIDFSQFGEISLQAMSKLHKVTAQNMQRSWLNVPHVTQFDEADITELETFRASLKAEAEQRGVRLTPLAFILKAVAHAVAAHPKFNVSLHNDGEHLVQKHYVHIGFAVDTPAGLVVPVIRDADKKSVWQLAEETAELAEKAKSRKLKPADMQGGCFTVSSLGNIGGTGFTPIVNAPEVAILGVSRLQVKPVWDGEQFAPRKMLPLSLSYDHRAINGADGGKFFTYLSGLLSDIRRLAL